MGRAQRVFRAVELLYVILQQGTHALTHLPEPPECTPPRVNPNVLQSTTLVGNRVMGEAMCVEGGGDGVWELWELSAQFCCKPRTALMKQSPLIFLKKEGKKSGSTGEEAVRAKGLTRVRVTHSRSQWLECKGQGWRLGKAVPESREE